MQVVIVIAQASALLAAAVVTDPVLMLAASAATLVYLIHLGSRLRHTERAVSEVLKAQGTAGACFEGALEERVRALGCMVAFLKTELDGYQRKGALTADKSASAGVGRDGLFSRVLEQGIRSFQATSGCVLQGGQVVKTVGVEEPAEVRFRGCVESLVRSRAEGIVDVRASSPEMFGLDALGYRYVVIAPFSTGSEGDGEGSVVFCYKAKRAPAGIETVWVRRLARELEAELLKNREVLSLQEKVSSAEAQARAKNEFVAHMSHDIRSPLNNVQAVLGLVKEECESEHIQGLVDNALSNCQSLRDIVEDVLDFSKFNAGMLKSRPETVVVGEECAAIIENYRVAARLRGLSVRVKDESAGAAVQVDRQQLRRVLANVVSNALKYTEHGEVSIVVARSGNAVVCRVSDTGVGMSKEELGRLFTPYTRFSRKPVEGVGLGLVLTKALVEVNGGRIAVESRPAMGTTFTISFSYAGQSERKDGEQSPLGVPPALCELKVARGSAGTILVVDDDADVVRTLGQALERKGYTVRSAVTVTDAISICNYEGADVVISDGEMPDGGGRALLKVFARWKAAPPVVMLSGAGDEAVREEALRLGAKAWLRKPQDVDALERVIAAHVTRPATANG